MARVKNRIYICEVCGRRFSGHSRPAKNRFCSNRCAGRWRSIQYRNSNNPNWRGFDISRKNGLRISIGNSRRETLHRLIIQSILKRGLTTNEVVHHINGNKLDNRLTNLLVCNKSYHHWLHATGRVLVEQDGNGVHWR